MLQLRAVTEFTKLVVSSLFLQAALTVNWFPLVATSLAKPIALIQKNSRVDPACN